MQYQNNLARHQIIAIQLGNRTELSLKLDQYAERVQQNIKDYLLLLMCIIVFVPLSVAKITLHTWHYASHTQKHIFLIALFTLVIICSPNPLLS